MTPRMPREDGFALVTALWAALILGLVASAIVMASRNDARIGRTAALQARQRAAAQGMVNLIELRLLGLKAGTLPLEGTPFAVTAAGFAGHVTLQDQAGLVDLNHAPAEMLTRLLTVAGQLDPATASRMTDRILDWRERGAGHRLNGAKADDYAAAGYAYAPREAPFESVAELKLVMGVSQGLYERISPAVTVYSQKQLVDPQVAPAVVLALLPGFDTMEIGRLLAQRARQHADGDVAPGLQDVSGRAIGVSVSLGDDAYANTVLTTTLRMTGNQIEPVWAYGGGVDVLCAETIERQPGLQLTLTAK